MRRLRRFGARLPRGIRQIDGPALERPDGAGAFRKPGLGRRAHLACPRCPGWPNGSGTHPLWRRCIALLLTVSGGRTAWRNVYRCGGGRRGGFDRGGRDGGPSVALPRTHPRRLLPERSDGFRFHRRRGFHRAPYPVEGTERRHAAVGSPRQLAEVGCADHAMAGSFPPGRAPHRGRVASAAAPELPLPANESWRPEDGRPHRDGPTDRAARAA
jgi:hypothetical protein